MIGDGVRPTAWGTPYSSARFAPSAGSCRMSGTYPRGASAYIAAQLGLPDVSHLAQYAERGQTHREHTAEIQRLYGYREFAETRSELESWLERRAWNRGDGPRVLFEAAWQWLRERRVLLPGITTLTRLVASIQERATQRLWETLAGLLDSDQEARLDQILEVADGARASTLRVPPEGAVGHQGISPTPSPG